MNSAAVPGTEAGRRRRQLPAEVSAFVGRADELKRLAGLLRGGRHVTVTGPGGVGKTRLALRAAADAADRYPDGSCLIELSAVADAGQLPLAVVQGLGLRGHDGDSAPAALLAYLRGKRLLLILDTCEHLADACGQLTAELLRAAGEVTILTTSRQPLHVPGEQVLRLGPLPVPPPGRDPAPGDAVELFARRAAAALPGFAVAETDRPDVIRLCRRLDGLPLAVELAAVRVRALPLAELAERLEARFSVLTGARRGTVERHQTLRAAIGWSYDLCTADEQTVWNRLSVFCGPFALAAAREVAACPPVPADRVGDVLAMLVDKSVVLQLGADRYRLLGCEREYGAEQLGLSGQEEECRRRLARRYRQLARGLGRHLLADDQAARLRALRAEQADISGVLAYGFGAGEPGWERAAIRLTSALAPYWLMSGLLREGIHWLDAALARLRPPSAERAVALADRATLGAMVGLPESAAQAREAITVGGQLGDDRAQARGYLALQLALGLRGSYPQAVEAADEARRRLSALGADAALRCLDVQLGQTHQIGGNPPAAAAAGQRALAGLGPGERWLHGHVHIVSALALYRRPGRQAECARAAAEALWAMRDLNNPIGEACALDVLGWLAADAGRCQRAAWLLGAAQIRWQRAGGRPRGNAVLASYHQRSADAAARALGPHWYAELHARGAGLPLDEVVELATTGGDPPPGEPRPRPGAGPLSGRPLLGVPEQRATSDNAARRSPGRGDQEELTGRELEIAALVALGLPNRDIAERLFISRRTVDAHINHIFGKLGLSSRVQLAIWARDRFGDLPPGAPLASAPPPGASPPSALPRSALPPSGHA
jgi:predicted ATPase/DNA-binding CsgD family transcriptional regulator